MQDEGRLAGPVDLARLHALVVGVEDEGVGLDLLEQHHPHVGQAARIDGGERHRVRVVDLVSLGLGEPGLRDGEGVVPGEDARRSVIPQPAGRVACIAGRAEKRPSQAASAGRPARQSRPARRKSR